MSKPAIYFDSHVLGVSGYESNFLNDTSKGHEYCKRKYPEIMRHCVAWYELGDRSESLTDFFNQGEAAEPEPTPAPEPEPTPAPEPEPMPELKLFNIWSDGFIATGERGGPILHASNVEAYTFEEACELHFAGDKLYNKEQGTYWGCDLHPEESLCWNPTK